MLGEDFTFEGQVARVAHRTTERRLRQRAYGAAFISTLGRTRGPWVVRRARVRPTVLPRAA